jgi:hypothetical protein
LKLLLDFLHFPSSLARAEHSFRKSFSASSWRKLIAWKSPSRSIFEFRVRSRDF